MSTVVMAICGLAWAAALTHVLAASDHLGEYPPFAVCFELVACAQFALGVLVYRRPTRRALLAAAALSGGLAAAWALSRTTGLPLGPERWEAEPVGPVDVIATADELALTALVALHLLRGRAAWAARLGALACPPALALVAVSCLAFVFGHAH